MQMSILIDAWARYRPDPNKKRKVAQSEKDLVDVFTQGFIDYCMAQIHLKIYDYKESEDQVNRKKEFK
jgi:hypothetical protein